jgi:hypothetical protein
VAPDPCGAGVQRRAEQSTLALAGFLVGRNPDMLTRANTEEGYLPLHVALGRDNGQGLSRTRTGCAWRSWP